MRKKLPKPKRLESMPAAKYFHTIDWIIVVLVVKKNALLYFYFLGSITNIENTEQMIGNI